MNALETKLNFSIFNAILFGSLRPWISENQNQERFSLILMNGLRAKIPSVDAFFKELISATKEANIDLNDDNFIESSILAKDLSVPLSLDLPPFINKKREFYGSLIKNETLRIQATIDSIISSQTDDDIAYSEANSLLQQIEFLIRESVKVQETDDDNLYIINGIKYSLFRLNKYMKDTFPDLLSVNILSDSEIIYMLAPNSEEDNLIHNFLAKKPKSKETKSSNKESQLPISTSSPVIISEESKIDFETSLKINKCDFRNGYKGKFTYDDITKAEFFVRFEEKLFEYGFIDEGYNFTNKHGYKKQLAAMYRILIAKGYFKPKSYKYQKGFTNAHYRQYLDHRYNVNTTQQFKRNTIDYIRDVEFQYNWLERLP